MQGLSQACFKEFKKAPEIGLRKIQVAPDEEVCHESVLKVTLIYNLLFSQVFFYNYFSCRHV